MDYLDEFATECKGAITDIGNGFDAPDDDWMPHFILRSPDGLVIAGIDPKIMATVESKDILANQILPKIISQSGATSIAMILSSWMSQHPKPKDGNLSKVTPPSIDFLNPTRREAVVLQVVSSTKIKTWCAEILRDKIKPPALLQWEDLNEGTFTGRFIEPAQKALAENVARMN